MSQLRNLLAGTLALSLVSGCAGPPAPEDHHFRLVPETPAALSAPVLDGPLRVKRFTADGLLAQRPLVYAKSSSPQALQQYNYHFWADVPTVMVQELVVRALRDARVSAQVTTPAHGVDADYELVGRIDRLEHVLGESPSVSVALEFGIVHPGRRELVWLRSYVVERPVDGPGVAAAVNAMSLALSDILSRVVDDLARR